MHLFSPPEQVSQWRTRLEGGGGWDGGENINRGVEGNRVWEGGREVRTRERKTGIARKSVGG